MEIQTSSEPFDPASIRPPASPVRLVLIVIFTLFVADAIVMAVLFSLPRIPELHAALVDSLLLIILVLPTLYLCLLRPLQAQIAAHQRSAATLAKSNELLNRLFSISHVMLACLDSDFNLVRLNNAYAEAAEKSVSQLVGKNHFDLFPDEENEAIFRQVVDTGKPYFAHAMPSTRSPSPERGVAYWDWNAIPLKDCAGRVDGLIVALVDVTEHRQAEIALIENETLLRKVRKRTEQEIRERNRQLATLNAISTATSSSFEMSQTLNSVKDVLEGQARFPAARIFTYHPDSRELRLELSWGLETKGLLPGYRLPVESYPRREILREKRVRRFSEGRTDGLRGDADIGPSSRSDSHCWLCIPLVADGEIQGLLELADNDNTPDPDKEGSRYFQAIGQIMGIAIYNTRLFAGEQKARQTSEVLREAGLALTQSLEMSTVMETLLDITGRLVPYDSASFLLVEDDNHLVVHAARGCECEAMLQSGSCITFERGRSDPVDQVIATRQGKLIADVPVDPPFKVAPCDAATRSWVGVPFVAGENVLGLFSLRKKEAGFYTAEHLQLAEALASQAAVAVQNAWLFGQLSASRERLQTLSRKLVEVQESERACVARELHDEAGQVLTSLMVGLRLLERDANRPEALAAGIGKLKGMVDGVLENLHRLAMNLRPASLDHLGLEAALRQHLGSMSENHHLTVEFETVGMDLRLPKDLEVALYRIVQEALANVVRHAHASRVDVLLKRRDGKVLAIVEDNGIGFDENAALTSGRLGLFGMRERAEMLGGRMLVECGRSGGTTVSVEVPCADSYSDCR